MIKIRRAQTSDTPQLETLFLFTRRSTFHWDSPDKFKLEDFKELTVGETVFVAEDQGGTIVGFVSVWLQDPIVFIHHLFVAPNEQRKRIGAQLIESLLTWAPLPYRLKCRCENIQALAFYQKCGWVMVEKGLCEDGEYLLLELPSAGSKCPV